MKKLLVSILVVLCLFATAIPLTACSSGDGAYMLSYELKDDGTYDCQGIRAKVAFSNADMSVLIIPSEYEGVAVTSVSASNYDFSENIKKIVLSEGITKIGGGDVEESESGHSVGEHAFSNYSALEEIELPSTLKEITSKIPSNVKVTIAEGNNTFEYKDNCIVEKETNRIVAGFDGAKVPDYATEICNFAFQNCQMSSLKIPTSVTKIGAFAFDGATIDQEINLEFKGNTLTAVQMFAFKGLEVNSVDFASATTEFSPNAFSECSFVTLINTVTPKVKFNEKLSFDGSALKWLYYSIGSKDIPDDIYLEVESDKANYRKFDYTKFAENN